MAGTVEFPEGRNPLARETQRTWLTAVFALAASLAMMLVASPSTVSPAAHWVVSSIALTTALVVFVAGQRAWGEMVTNAQAAGVVER
ncbi:hypothetical protein ACAG24_006415 [Mycobacterium sp. pW049]|uniref:hypothetical protein n=1 Tax=[Mycobacterium] bulgaricum TaxID=3238985 RepID=UPI00351B87B1